jgi:hypothetical protein
VVVMTASPVLGTLEITAETFAISHKRSAE